MSRAALHPEVSAGFGRDRLADYRRRRHSRPSFPETLALHWFSRRPIIAECFFFFSFIDFFLLLSLMWIFFKHWHSRRSSHGLLKTFLFSPSAICFSIMSGMSSRDSQPSLRPRNLRKISFISAKLALPAEVTESLWEKQPERATDGLQNTGISAFWKKLLCNSRSSL